MFEGKLSFILFIRDALLEKQCRFYCTKCKLLISYRQSPPGEPSKYVFISVFTRYTYIVKGSVTTDPDIMLREVKNYKLQIPAFIQVCFTSFFHIARSRGSNHKHRHYFVCVVWSANQYNRRSR